MKAVIGDKLGPPSHYAVRDVPTPLLSNNEILIKVQSAGVGFVDTLLAAGNYQVKPPTPFTPGTDFVGEIMQLGCDVHDYAIGERVCGQSFGGAFAEYLSIAPTTLVRIPPELPASNAAGVYINYHTAIYALNQRARLRSGESVLVLGAAGGVGTATIQVAKALGAHVIAAASSTEKRDYAKSLGADHVIDYTQPAAEWRDQLKEITQGQGVDVVIDPVGGDSFEPAFRSLAWDGRLVVIGFAGGEIPKLPANLPLLKGADLRGADFRQFTLRDPAQLAENTKLLEHWLAEGIFLPPGGTEFALADFAAALDAAVSRDVAGKVILKVAS